MTEREVTVTAEGMYIVFHVNGKEVQSYPMLRALTRPGMIEERLIYLLTGKRVYDARAKVAREVFLNDE